MGSHSAIVKSPGFFNSWQRTQSRVYNFSPPCSCAIVTPGTFLRAAANSGLTASGGGNALAVDFEPVEGASMGACAVLEKAGVVLILEVWEHAINPVRKTKRYFLMNEN